MPVNHSDLIFFKLLAEKMSALPQSDQPIGIKEIRESVKLFRSYVDEPADINFYDKSFQSKRGHQINLRYYSVITEKKPLIIYFPGNAFIHDMLYENHSIISKIAKHANCNAIMVQPRLSPEHPYPQPLEDAVEAVEYIIRHVDEFHFDKNKIVLAGFSSGANLAAVIANQLRNNNEINIYHQLLISGAYDYTDSLHEYDEYALQDKMLDPVAAQFSFDCYSKPSQRKESTCSPYWEKDLSGLPPTTIIVGEYDGGRSQSEAYAKKLIEAGNQVKKIVSPGQTHGTIIYRKICSDGEDPAVVAGKEIFKTLFAKAS